MFANDDLSSIDKPRGLQLIKERIDLIHRLQHVDSYFDIQSNPEGTKIVFIYPADLR